MKQYSVIRENLGVPITNTQTGDTEYHHDSEALPIERVENEDEQMQIFKNGHWYDAYSINFDFQ